MWILPVEVWGLRYRSKCLSSCYVVYFLLLALSYLISFWWHSNGYTEKGLEEQALKAPTSLQRNLLEYAALITFVGVYVFLALPETTGLMFEDSDALFSLEEYDVIGFCFPRGTGTGYLGRVLCQRKCLKHPILLSYLYLHVILYVFRFQNF